MPNTPLAPVHTPDHYQRLYRLLSEFTAAVFVNANNLAAICTQACQVAVEVGGYRYAFVGMLDSRSPYITPTYNFGEHGGYLDGLRLSIDAAHPEGRGPTGIAARTLAPCIVNDLRSDPLMAFWRDRAVESGVCAAAAFPLVHGNRNIFGVLNLYSGTPNRFDPDEIELINRMVQQIAVAYGRHREEEKRHIADADRRQAQVSLANIVDMAGDAIITANEQKQIQLFNKAAEELFGWRLDEVIGKPLDILIPPEVVGGHDEHLRLFTARSDNGVRHVHRREVEAVRKDGSRFPAANSFSMVRSNGKWIYIATLRDVTAAKAAEAALLQVHNMLERAAKEWRVTFDTVISPVIICDQERRIRRLNKAASSLMGLPPADIVAEPLEKILSGKTWNALHQACNAVIETGTPKQLSVTEKGQGRQWHITVSPWGDHVSDGNGTGIVLVGTDVTELLRLQESVRESETMAELGQLIAGVSHEVRNPLFGMTATLDAFELKHGTDPAFARYLEALRRELARMAELVRDLLDYGKPLELSLTPVHLRDVLEEAAEMLAKRLQDKRVTLQVNAPPEVAPIQADANRLVLVLGNLIGNAIFFAPEGSTIRVTIHQAEEEGQHMLWCSVRDEGPGFPPQNVEKVFKPFFSRRKGGTGLGLSIVARIVAKHGGIVRAQNHPYGGAEVTFGLPVL